MATVREFFRSLFWKSQERAIEEGDHHQSQLQNLRFPLNDLPNELLEFILRYIISNYGHNVFQKLLENVPALQSKVLLVTETGKGGSHVPLLNPPHNVPMMDIKSYERSMVNQSHRKPLIVFFSFYPFHLTKPGLVTHITRFVDDGPYNHLFNNKSVILSRDPSRRTYDPGYTLLFPGHNPRKHLKDLAVSKGATLWEMECPTATAAWPIGTEDTFWTINSANLTAGEEFSGPLHAEPRYLTTSNENNRLLQRLKPLLSNNFGAELPEPRAAVSLYLSNIHSELRYGGYNSFNNVPAWTSPRYERLENLRVLMNKSCAPNPTLQDDRCAERKVELGEKTGYEYLHIEFLSSKMPLIIDNSDKRVRDGWLTARKLIVDNLNWTYENPYGEVCDHTHELGLDQHSWSLDDRDPDDDRFRVRCNVMMLIGITDRFLEYSRWRSVTVLYWRRLEPRVRIRDYEEKYPAVIDCPSLTQLKIFSIVRKDRNERAHFPQFKVPQLEKLVLVLLKDSERCWNVKKLLNNQWPRTLRHLTISAHRMIEGSPLQLLPENTIPPYLRHLTIQRMIPQFSEEAALRLTGLRYLELDITAIEPTLLGQDKYHHSINIVLNQAIFPVLETLIISVPQRAFNTFNFAVKPVHVKVPESCHTVGIATMLSRSSVDINDQRIEFPGGCNSRSTREVFVAFVRDQEGRFVGGDQELMAEYGRPLDTCLEVQWESFDTERKTQEDH